MPSLGGTLSRLRGLDSLRFLHFAFVLGRHVSGYEFGDVTGLYGKLEEGGRELWVLLMRQESGVRTGCQHVFRMCLFGDFSLCRGLRASGIRM
jgi:hypothetical protein